MIFLALQCNCQQQNSDPNSFRDAFINAIVDDPLVDQVNQDADNVKDIISDFVDANKPDVNLDIANGVGDFDRTPQSSTAFPVSFNNDPRFIL